MRKVSGLIRRLLVAFFPFENPVLAHLHELPIHLLKKFKSPFISNRILLIEYFILNNSAAHTFRVRDVGGRRNVEGEELVGKDVG